MTEGARFEVDGRKGREKYGIFEVWREKIVWFEKVD